MGKTRYLKKIKRYQGNISCKDGHNKGQKGKDLTEAKRLRRGGTNTQKNYTKKVLMTWINCYVQYVSKFGKLSV